MWEYLYQIAVWISEAFSSFLAIPNKVAQRKATGTAVSKGREETLVQLYWAILETWSAQVDSYWTRTNYFAAFELAAIAGSWVVLDDRRLIAGHCSLLIAAILIFFLSFLLTGAWIFSNLKSYDYHMYWWSVLRDIETGGGWEGKAPDYISGYENRRGKRAKLDGWKYHNFTNYVVPIASLVIWVALIIGMFWLRWRQIAH